jgi:hypothetical protein
MSVKPGIDRGFRHDRQDLDRFLGHIVKHPNVIADARAILRMQEPAQTLDAALAHFGWLMPQMLLNGITDRITDVGFEIIQVLDRFWGQHDLVSHSGHIVARFATLDKPAEDCLSDNNRNVRISATVEMSAVTDVSPPPR